MKAGSVPAGSAPSAALVVRPRDVAVGGPARRARRQQFLGQPAQVLDERQLQHARPRPQLADRQRRDALVAVQELDQLLAIEPAVAVADQLDGDRVDARVTGVLARGERSAACGSRCAADSGGCRRSRPRPGGSCRAASPPPARRTARSARRRPACDTRRAARGRCPRSAETCRGRGGADWDRRSGWPRAPARAPRAARCSGARRAAASRPPAADAA